MARQILCGGDRCRSFATVHIEYRSGGTYVKMHRCGGCATRDAAAVERAVGIRTTTQPISDSCRAGSC